MDPYDEQLQKMDAYFELPTTTAEENAQRSLDDIFKYDADLARMSQHFIIRGEGYAELSAGAAAAVPPVQRSSTTPMRGLHRTLYYLSNEELGLMRERIEELEALKVEDPKNKVYKKEIASIRQKIRADTEKKIDPHGYDAKIRKNTQRVIEKRGESASKREESPSARKDFVLPPPSFPRSSSSIRPRWSYMSAEELQETTDAYNSARQIRDEGKLTDPDAIQKNRREINRLKSKLYANEMKTDNPDKYKRELAKKVESRLARMYQ